MARFRLKFPRRWAPALAVVIACMASASVQPGTVAAGRAIPAEIAARLNDKQKLAYGSYLEARSAFDKALDLYWQTVEELREARKQKRSAGQPIVASDYMLEQPPSYAGPSVPADVARIIAELRPPEPVAPIPAVADFLAAAKAQFEFAPTPASEAQFKRHYAEQALAVGLTKAQVVRVYALETGGRGTYDMQAGIDPESKKGTPISTALGYAQLLNANSVSGLVRHGEEFIRRLEAMAAQSGILPARAAALRAKAQALRRMLKAARSVPNEWRAHTVFAGTSRGLAIHTLNLDGDVGPWLQVLKLKSLLEHAARAGRPQLSGAELELMNLAGPRTGLEMMEPVGRTAPTANFFSRGGYYRNTIVRGKTGAELLAALDERMEQNLLKKGAIEFAAAFDEAMKRHSAGAARAP